MLVVWSSMGNKNRSLCSWQHNFPLHVNECLYYLCYAVI